MYVVKTVVVSFGPHAPALAVPVATTAVLEAPEVTNVGVKKQSKHRDADPDEASTVEEPVGA